MTQLEAAQLYDQKLDKIQDVVIQANNVIDSLTQLLEAYLVENGKRISELQGEIKEGSYEH